MTQVGWIENFNVESQSLEERNRIFSLYFLENDCEFVVRDLINEVTLELNDHVVSREDGAERISRIAKEAESITFLDDRVVKTSLNRRLRGHNGEVEHIFEALVADLDREGESLGVWVDNGGTHLLEFNLCLQLLDRFLYDGILLIEHIDD